MRLKERAATPGDKWKMQILRINSKSARKMKEIMTKLKLQFLKVSEPGRGCLSTLVGLTLLLFHGQNANAQTCFPGVGANIGIQTPYSILLTHCAGTPVSCQSVMVAHVGETITILGGQVSSSGSGCAVTNGQGWIVYPNNTVQKAIQDFSLQSGADGGA